MSLAALQLEFMGKVLDDQRPLPASWGQRMADGLEVYRNAYRARLVEALREIFPCTVKWAGEESFRAAAAHYLISEPPTGWTLDGVGGGFVKTIEALFAGDPDVADLAWLEWAMHCAFTAAELAPLDPGGFIRATARFGENDWEAMRLQFVPALHVRSVRFDCAALWRGLQADDGTPAEKRLEESACCLVWREGHSPVFRLIDGGEGECLDRMMQGTSFGDVCARLSDRHDESIAAETAGQMLRDWLSLGLIASIKSEALRATTRV